MTRCVKANANAILRASFKPAHALTGHFLSGITHLSCCYGAEYLFKHDMFLHFIFLLGDIPASFTCFCFCCLSTTGHVSLTNGTSACYPDSQDHVALNYVYPCGKWWNQSIDAKNQLSTTIINPFHMNYLTDPFLCPTRIKNTLPVCFWHNEAKFKAYKEM